MPLVVHTAPYRYAGPDRVDITRGGKHDDEALREAFAPSWRLLNWGKAQLERASTDSQRDWAFLAYEARYTEAMRVSYKERREQWDALLSRQRAVLVCFCADPRHCHRRVLAEILERCGATYAGELDTHA